MDRQTPASVRRLDRRSFDVNRPRKKRPSIGSTHEVGSATISLRKNVVDQLADEDDEEGEGAQPEVPGPSTGHRGHPSITENVAGPSQRPHRGQGTPSSRRKLLDHDASGSGSSRPSSPRPRPKIHFDAPPPPPRPHTVASKPSRRRPRAFSYHVPSLPSLDRNFYLPHFSTDTQYSLPDDPSKPKVALELGLGDDFDLSFGEAMRRGVGGEEMPLPQEAMRVLNEAKENLDKRVNGKQGRKGSIGMGLFKETRAAQAVKDLGAGWKGQTVLEEEEPEPTKKTTPKKQRKASRDSLKSPSSPTPVKRGSIVDSVRRLQLDERVSTDDEVTSAGIQIVSSPFLSREVTRQTSDDESDWTTTSEISLSSLAISDDEEDLTRGTGYTEDDEQAVVTEGSGDEERMTVPLQPFDHAVGGHSSIYKFTRRAVCKVSATEPINSQARMSSLLVLLLTYLAPGVPRKPVLRGSRAPRPRSPRFHTSIPRRHAGQLSAPTCPNIRRNRRYTHAPGARHPLAGSIKPSYSWHWPQPRNQPQTILRQCLCRSRCRSPRSGARLEPARRT